MPIWRRYLRIVCAAILLGDFVAIGTLVAIYRFPEWHDHLLRFTAACYVAFLGLEGSSSHGFFSPIAVSVFTILASIVVIRYMHGVAAMQTRLWEDTIIALTALIVFTTLVYGPQFAWEVVRTVHDDHNRLVARVQHLQNYGKDEKQLHDDLDAAQAKANRWLDAYNRISKGETVPDRILSKEDTERLHDSLEEYKKASKDRRYSTVRIAPAFYGDLESTQLAQNLLKVFQGAHWDATWEMAHAKGMANLIMISRPTNIIIYTDDPNNEAYWIMHMLSGIGLLATISNGVPDGFKGTLVCVGYKTFYPPPQ
jgi:hypothetical protein